jgi:hypothetical protein
MRRWSYIATFCLIFFSLPLWAQHRAVGGAHITAGRGFAGHSSGPPHGGAFHGGNHGADFGQRWGGHVRLGSSHWHRGIYGRGFYYPNYAYAYYPYLGDYGWSSGSFDDQSEDSYGDSFSSAPSSPPYREDSGLQRDVQTLSGKVDRPQAEAESRNRPNLEQEPATALVFRDNHVEEVRNYAISGGTLWVLNVQAAKKIPLAQLDLDATAKMNDDRGVDFQIPEPALSIMIMR